MLTADLLTLPRLKLFSNTLVSKSQVAATSSFVIPLLGNKPTTGYLFPFFQNLIYLFDFIYLLGIYKYLVYS